MEFDFNVNEVLPDVITFVDYKRSPFRKNAQHPRQLRSQLDKIVDSLGNESAKAQCLHNVITTAAKLQHSDHEMYIRKDQHANGGSGVVIGMIKVGRKTLFLLDSHGIQNEVIPLCVLDFYVHSSQQRNGYGKELFEHMLKIHNLQPAQVAIDRPSYKFQSFLKKHYGLKNAITQPNKFLVFDQFFRDLNAVGYVPRRSQRRKSTSGNTAIRPPIHPYQRNTDKEVMQTTAPPRRISSRQTSRNEQAMETDCLVDTILPVLARPPSREHSAGSVKSMDGIRSRESSAGNRGLAAHANLYSRHGALDIIQNTEPKRTRNVVSAGKFRSLHIGSDDNPLTLHHDGANKCCSFPGPKRSFLQKPRDQESNGLNATGNYTVSSRLSSSAQRSNNRGTSWNVFGVTPLDMSASKKQGKTNPF